MLQLKYYSAPVRAPFQWCSVRLSDDSKFSQTTNDLGVPGWHGFPNKLVVKGRPTVFFDGHAKTLMQYKYRNWSQHMLNNDMQDDYDWKRKFDIKLDEY